MNKQRLFVASCISLVTTSMVFSIRGDVEGAMSAAFFLTKEQMGLIWGPALWGFTIAIFICGAVVDLLGMRLLHILSALGYLVGVTMVITAPPPPGPVADIFGSTGTIILYAGFLLMGLSQGIVEGVINPLVASLYRDDKTHKLNVLHAWWPGGLIIGGLAAVGLTQFNTPWQVKLGLIMVPAVIYLIMAATMPYPQTERVEHKVPAKEMWKEALRPLFLLLFVCMWMTAATELGPDQWFPSIMKELAGIEGTLFLVYTAGLMFVLRFFAGPIAHRISPFGMLVGCSILSGIGLYWLGSLQPGTSPVIAFAAATVFGVGKTYFWPTMLGITAEQFPRGGGLLMNLMGGAGMLSVAIALPLMGKAFDQAGAGAALQLVAILPAILTVIFGGLYLGFKARGGYKAQHIAPTEAG